MFEIIHISELTTRERKNYHRHLAKIDRRIRRYHKVFPTAWDALCEATLKDWICVILFAAGIFTAPYAIGGMIVMIEAIIG